MMKKQEAGSSVEVEVIEPVLSSKTYGKRWTQWIQKVWGTDPLLCPRCGEKMDIIAFIEDQVVIRKILVSMDVWDIPERPPPKALFRDLNEYESAS